MTIDPSDPTDKAAAVLKRRAEGAPLAQPGPTVAAFRAARPSPWRKRFVLSLAGAGFAVASFSGLAYADALPDSLQSAASSAAHAVGLSVPRPPTEAEKEEYRQGLEKWFVCVDKARTSATDPSVCGASPAPAEVSKKRLPDDLRAFDKAVEEAHSCVRDAVAADLDPSTCVVRPKNFGIDTFVEPGDATNFQAALDSYRACEATSTTDDTCVKPDPAAYGLEPPEDDGHHVQENIAPSQNVEDFKAAEQAFKECVKDGDPQLCTRPEPAAFGLPTRPENVSSFLAAIDTWHACLYAHRSEPGDQRDATCPRPSPADFGLTGVPNPEPGKEGTDTHSSLPGQDDSNKPPKTPQQGDDGSTSSVPGQDGSSKPPKPPQQGHDGSSTSLPGQDDSNKPPKPSKGGQDDSSTSLSGQDGSNKPPRPPQQGHDDSASTSVPGELPHGGPSTSVPPPQGPGTPPPPPTSESHGGGQDSSGKHGSDN